MNLKQCNLNLNIMIEINFEESQSGKCEGLFDLIHANHRMLIEYSFAMESLPLYKHEKQ